MKPTYIFWGIIIIGLAVIVRYCGLFNYILGVDKNTKAPIGIGLSSLAPAAEISSSVDNLGTKTTIYADGTKILLYSNGDRRKYFPVLANKGDAYNDPALYIDTPKYSEFSMAPRSIVYFKSGKILKQYN